MHFSWKVRFVRLFIVIGEMMFGIKPEAERARFVFNKIRVIGTNILIIGESITKMKFEFGQDMDLNLAPQGPAGSDYEHGSVAHTVQAQKADGTDVSGEFTVQPDPANELHLQVVRTRVAGEIESECTGVVTSRADGDPDADETAPIVGTFDFIYDAPNVTGFEVTGTAITPTP